MSFELFIEVTRNNEVESRHFGAAVVCDYQGNIRKSWGDAEQLIFPRSALKQMLAIDVIESGACDHFDLSDAELTLACASHQGEAMHQNLVEAWLKRLNLGTGDLACGKALPDDIENAHRIIAMGNDGCRSHHNCSGKHAAFLTNALHLGLSTENYHLIGHPLQQRAVATLSDLAAVDLWEFPMGIDGCGFPALTMPLSTLAHAIARFARPQELGKPRAGAIGRLHAAIAKNPFYAAGHGTVVSALIQVTKGAVLAKTGAEGVIVAALPKHGLGLALKIADGSSRARAAALLAILEHLGILSDTEKKQLRAHMKPLIRNSRGEVVGEIRRAEKWLAGMKNPVRSNPAGNAKSSR
ncbi:MAG: asparaginase [Paracoccaceae bacterium]